jgi:survival-of-motor-neuron-related-splicing factor 30
VLLRHTPTHQVRQALLGQGNPSWAVGAPCLALYAADGQYYPATVKAVSEGGKFVVVYEGYGNEEEVRRCCHQRVRA